MSSKMWCAMDADGNRFLTDVKKAGSLSPGQRIKSNVIPLVTGMSFFSGSPSGVVACDDLMDVDSGVRGNDGD